MAKVDKKKALEMFKNGDKPKDMAKSFKVSVQAIYDFRREFIKKGQLTIGPRKATTQVVAGTPKMVKRNSDGLQWTNIQEALLRVLQQAKRAEELEAENWKMRNRIGVLENALKGKDDKLMSAKEFELMQQRGELPKSLTVGDKKDYFTEHIDCATLPLLSLYNITLTPFNIN